jgi:hypothetical protein
MGTSTTNGRGLAIGRALLLAFAVVASVVGGYYGQPWIHENDRAVDVIVTSFSILAGFLVAIMTIVGDPGLFGHRSWRAQELAGSIVRRRLERQGWLFILYLVTLCVIFAESLLSREWPQVSTVLERIYLGMAILAFILSLRLPAMLMRLQIERHDEAVEARRSRGRRTKEPSADGQ